MFGMPTEYIVRSIAAQVLAARGEMKCRQRSDDFDENIQLSNDF